MKKLMIAVAVVCAAAMSQAANVVWNWTGQMQQGYAGSSSAYAGTVYIFNANSIDQDDILTAFLGGKSWTGDAMDSYTTANGKMGSSAQGDLGATTDFTPTRDDSGTKVIDYFYASVVKYNDTDYLFLSATSTADVLGDEDTSLAAALKAPSQNKITGAKTFSAGGWYEASAVPEPFSGTLALLGMGAIALRRKMKKAKKA